jgi:hypothetical protein
MKFSFYFIIFILLFSCTTHKKIQAPAGKPVAVSDSAAKRAAWFVDSIRLLARSEIKPYAAVITKNYRTERGLFTIHQFRDSIYFEIPDSMLRRDIMVINRITKAPGGFGAYSGEELDEKTILFEKGPNATINIRYDLIISEADTTSAIYKAVVRSNLNPVVVSLPIKAYGKDSASYVVDGAKFLKDNTTFVNSIDQSQLTKAMDSRTMKDVNIESIHAYPINVEVALSKNGISKPVPNGSPAGPYSLETHTSFILLPKVPMQRRYFDPRVGYFADYYYPYSDDQQKVAVRQFILHWRLEPRAEDQEKWKQGQLVEPQNPIVFYIDPATPKQWRKYLIMGINDWQKAFEQAGFKNAIMGKEWPEHDNTMSMEDARYSVVHYFPSETKNAYGPQVHDPRSGEIIQSRIGWYHNVMELLHDWYFIQAGAVDPKARVTKFDEELMGQLIRFVSSHEVGHTLGLRHNFGSSSRTPVDSLRSKNWLHAHGHTASIMDYARFNYVAQPEDHLTEDELFPHIGEYDRWAIEWGYKYSGAPNADEDRKLVTRWIVDSLANNPRLWFGDGESRKSDPRCQTEDLGDNAVKASYYGIKNLQRILPNLPGWSQEPDGIYKELNNSYKTLKGQYSRYLGHVLSYVGGVYYTIQNEEGKQDAFTISPKAMQKDALNFINTQLFNTPYWLLDKNVINKVNEPSYPDYVEDLQVRMINSLLDTKQINQLLAVAHQFGSDKTLPADEYFNILHQNIWQELHTSSVSIDSYRRNLQKTYIGNLQDIFLANDPELRETDAASIARADMLKVQKEITQAIPKAKDAITRYHLEDLAMRIKKTLSDKE